MPIQTSYDGQIIQNLDLYVNSGDAITITNDNVTIQNVRIHYDGNTHGVSDAGGASGIVVEGAQNVTIQHVEVDNTAIPSGGKSARLINYDIYAADSSYLRINDVTVRDGSTGIELNANDANAALTNVDGYNFHGPFPRGQFIQVGQNSDNTTISGFYAYDGLSSSYTEDNISVFGAQNVRISNGLIDGNNSPSGVGIMFETGFSGRQSSGGYVAHVDAVHMGDGAFSAYSDDVSFDYTRSFDNHAGGADGRGVPLSGALIWAVQGNGDSITNSTYTEPAVSWNILWDESLLAPGHGQVSLDQAGIPMVDPVTHHFLWAGAIGVPIRSHFVTVDDPSAVRPDGTTVVGLNSHGTRVGIFTDTDGTHGFVRTHGRFITINDPSAAAGETSVSGINESHNVVGSYQTGDGEYHGFFLRKGHYTTIDDPLAIGNVYANDLNNARSVVGSYEDISGLHGFVDRHGAFTTIDDPAAIGGSANSLTDGLNGTDIKGVNDKGELVGAFDDTNGTHGFIFNHGVFKTLDDPLATGGTFAESVNDRGQVVGYYFDDAGAHGFLYAHGIYRTIDDPLATGSTFAFDINNRSQIAGSYADVEGTHGFVHTPGPPHTHSEAISYHQDLLWV